jgi:hypothetical protein
MLCYALSCFVTLQLHSPSNIRCKTCLFSKPLVVSVCELYAIQFNFLDVAAEQRVRGSEGKSSGS